MLLHVSPEHHSWELAFGKPRSTYAKPQLLLALSSGLVPGLLRPDCGSVSPPYATNKDPIGMLILTGLSRKFVCLVSSFHLPPQAATLSTFLKPFLDTSASNSLAVIRF